VDSGQRFLCGSVGSNCECIERGSFSKTRPEAFSDGVLAIAISLLVFDTLPERSATGTPLSHEDDRTAADVRPPSSRRTAALRQRNPQS
jgi:hypothetical protein